MKKIILFLSVFLLGCQTQTPTPKLDIKIERPRPVTLKKVAFNIIRVHDKSYIALDSLNYNNLSYNMLELQRFIKGQNLVIETYEKSKWLHF